MGTKRNRQEFMQNDTNAIIRICIVHHDYKGEKKRVKYINTCFSKLPSVLFLFVDTSFHQEVFFILLVPEEVNDHFNVRE